MKKIPTLFMRNPEDRRHVMPELTVGCEWVVEGFGIARRKYDGTCVMLDESGNWWARREVKPGKMPPPNYAAEQLDEITGKAVGWEPIGQSAFAKYHAEALTLLKLADSTGILGRDLFMPGTFELVGPKINGNPEKADEHMLVRHSLAQRLELPDRSFAQLRQILPSLHEKYGYEGVVFHHPDGRMAKLKARDFPKESAS